MSAKARLFVAAVVGLAVVATVLLLWVRSRPSRRLAHVPAAVPTQAAPVDLLRLASVPVESRDLRVEVRDLRVQSDQGRMDWSFALACRQPGGCRGEVRVTVHYLSQGRTQELEADRELDLAEGGEVRLGRTLRSVHAVERVERVTVQRVGGASPGGPRPTPIG